MKERMRGSGPLSLPSSKAGEAEMAGGVVIEGAWPVLWLAGLRERLAGCRKS